MIPLHTFGYRGKKHLPSFLASLEKDNGVVADIRHVPHSRLAGWSGSALQRALPARYVHIPAWGNKHFRQKDAPIELVSLEEGRTHLLSYLEGHAPGTSVVLLCACEALLPCHRATLVLSLDDPFDYIGEWALPSEEQPC